MKTLHAEGEVGASISIQELELPESPYALPSTGVVGHIR